MKTMKICFLEGKRNFLRSKLTKWDIFTSKSKLDALLTTLARGSSLMECGGGRTVYRETVQHHFQIFYRSYFTMLDVWYELY